MDGVDLVHDDEVGILVIVLNGIDHTPEQWIVHFIVASLLQLEVLNATQKLKQIFNDVLFLTTVLS